MCATYRHCKLGLPTQIWMQFYTSQRLFRLRWCKPTRPGLFASTSGVRPTSFRLWAVAAESLGSFTPVPAMSTARRLSLCAKTPRLAQSIRMASPSAWASRSSRLLRARRGCLGASAVSSASITLSRQAHSCIRCCVVASRRKTSTSLSLCMAWTTSVTFPWRTISSQPSSTSLNCSLPAQ